jgi:hypothetical protein
MNELKSQCEMKAVLFCMSFGEALKCKHGEVGENGSCVSYKTGNCWNPSAGEAAMEKWELGE